MKKLPAAKEVFDKLPPDSIDVVMKVRSMQVSDDFNCCEPESNL